MGKILFKNADFAKTAILPKDYPILRDKGGKVLPEIALMGRSNVGKSSLLNHLFQSKGLVKTSSTPGKTRGINFFTLNSQLSFVDLPGYGYAAVNKEMSRGWQEMIENYLKERKELCLFLFLLDIRRVPSEEDMKMREWLEACSKPFILVLTKVDKVSLAERALRTHEILRSLDLMGVPYVHYSTLKNEGRKELIQCIEEVLDGES